LKKGAKQPATVGDVERRVAALKREIRGLVDLVGEDDAVGASAVHVLYGLPELVSGQLAAAISRPRSRVHLLKLIFLARVLGPKGSLDTQKALHRLTKLKDDDGIAAAAADVLGELLGDEMQEMAEAAHRGRHGRRGTSVGGPLSFQQPRA
jgi:hypothetical protein